MCWFPYGVAYRRMPKWAQYEDMEPEDATPLQLLQVWVTPKSLKRCAAARAFVPLSRIWEYVRKCYL